MSGAAGPSRGALVVFAKKPSPGAVKTRLVPSLSAPDAARLYACFLEDTLDRARGLRGAELFLAYHPTEERYYFQGLARRYGFRLIAQKGGDLADRMIGVLERLFSSGLRPVIAIGSDCPTLPLTLVRRGFALLEHSRRDVVLAPGRDGGYVLIGFAAPSTEVLRVEMSRPEVLARTIEQARGLGLALAILPSWYDVDLPADLEHLRRELASWEGKRRRDVPRKTSSFLSIHGSLGTGTCVPARA